MRDKVIRRLFVVGFTSVGTKGRFFMSEKISYILSLTDKLNDCGKLTHKEWETLLDNRCDISASYAAKLADVKRRAVYGNDVYVRGLIEISNICKNDCYYCGIRKSNKSCDRYRLTEDDILLRCDEGYALGFRTFVLQGGEDMYYTDNVMCSIVGHIKEKHPDCAVTLSIGERSRESYSAMYNAGADRYLLRHETANEEHYMKLHPKEMSYINRMRCLYDLRDIGYQVGCGFMVGSPYQTNSDIAYDLEFITEFQPDMCGIGPFVPHHATPFAHFRGGTVEVTTYLLSLIRLIKPNILLPSTTALGTIHPRGRELGILAGANVVMPNLSPAALREKYELYDNKISSGEEAAECRANLERRMETIGFHVVTSRGDIIKSL